MGVVGKGSEQVQSGRTSISASRTAVLGMALCIPPQYGPLHDDSRCGQSLPPPPPLRRVGEAELPPLPSPSLPSPLRWVGEAERQLRLLFEEAQKHQPSIIFFDEIDGLAPVRSSKQVRSVGREGESGEAWDQVHGVKG